MTIHTAGLMAMRQLPSMLPGELVWPYDCKRRCSEMVNVPTGPAVADELTRGLREPHRSAIRGQWR